MAKQSRWAKCKIKCPEKMGESELFIEWHIRRKKETLNSISCDNPKLRDLSGNECQWSCWEKFSKLRKESL